MGNYPSGTVTFLFTDIEGSTKLAQGRPDKWESLQQSHHAILQSAIEAHNGYVFQIIGDAFCAAFHTASDGLSAAIEAQRKLQTESWDETPVKVRMGLHTGSAELKDNDYHGYMTLARVQRVMSVAYGGQILLSNATSELIHNELPEGISLRDLKEHRLKGLLNPEHLWQIVAPDLKRDFPPLQSLNETPNNLPVQLTSFIGREKEVRQVKQRLEKNRLVTLTGSGGIGKTRLSIQVATELMNEYPNGVWLLELAPLADPALVIQAACTALNVTPPGGMPALNALTDHLRAKKILLVVDNCEHLIDACAQLAESLLQACPGLRMIASSREALGIEGESAYRVPSLSLPDSKSGLHIIEESEAVKLFMERANAILPEFEITESNAPIIVQVCQRLDGIALAIELAASRVKILKVEQIASRLDDAFRLLTGGSRTALPRQQTLRALIDWSYNLLSDEERIVLRRLSVFVGAWTLEAAEAVCGNPDILDLLTRLVDKSLVTIDREHSDEIRYYFLETIRQYAREKLAEANEAENSRIQHLRYFLKLAKEAEPQLRYGTKQLKWLDRLEREHDNFRAALEWSLESKTKEGLELAGALLWFWVLRGYFAEGYELLEKASTASVHEDASIRAKLLSGAGLLAAYFNIHKAEMFLTESISLFRSIEDNNGLAFSLLTLGEVIVDQTDILRAKELFQDSHNLFSEARNRWGISRALVQLGELEITLGNYEQAKSLYRQVFSLAREMNDKDGMCDALLGLGMAESYQNNLQQAMTVYKEALLIAREGEFKFTIAQLLNRMGDIALASGDHVETQSLNEECMEIAKLTGTKSELIGCFFRMSKLARLQENYQQAIIYMNQYLILIQETIFDSPLEAYMLLESIALYVKLGNFIKAVRLFGALEENLPRIYTSVLPIFTARAEYEGIIVFTRAELGEDNFNTAYTEGRALNLEQAIALALEE
jgi:predicted ATPase/class 3 adenylate cyclase